MAFKIKKMPDLTIIPPDRSFWLKVATQVAKSIRQRTEDQGVDAHGKTFPGYTAQYAKFRRKKGRGTKANLSFSGKMLGALARGVSATKNSARVMLSGFEGAKAYYNEKHDRIFMEISKQDSNEIIKGVSRWVARKNKLK